MSRFAPALLSALALVATGAAAAPSDPTTVEGVVVNAPSKVDTDRIAGFVTDVTATGGDKRLGRWDRKVCPGVIGMDAKYAQFMVDRISLTAQAIGLEVSPPGCRPDILIIATDDSDAMLKQAIKDHPDAFAKYDDGVTRGRKALKAFVASQAPVRWWHVAARTTADGQRYDVGDSVRVRGAGRLNSNTRVDFDHVIILVDGRRIGVVRFGALADYVAMVSLAQINPDADTAGTPSILNLFSDRAAGVTPAEGLTDWDMAYLKGLYSARRDALKGSRQEADVTRSMAVTLKEPAPAPKAEVKPRSGAAAKPTADPASVATPEPKPEPKPDLDRERPDRSGF